MGRSIVYAAEAVFRPSRRREVLDFLCRPNRCAVSLIAAVALLPGCGETDAEPPAEPSQLAVSVIPVERTSQSERRLTYGRLQRTDDAVRLVASIEPELVGRLRDAGAFDAVIGTETLSLRVGPTDPATGQTVLLPASDADAASLRESPGAIVAVRFDDPQPLDGVRVPIGSLRSSLTDGWAIMLASPVNAAEGGSDYEVIGRLVEVLAVNGTTAVIDVRVAEGEQIIATGGNRVVLGQRVTIDDAASKQAADVEDEAGAVP